MVGCILDLEGGAMFFVFPQISAKGTDLPVINLVLMAFHEINCVV